MTTTTRIDVPARLTVLLTLAQLLERLERSSLGTAQGQLRRHFGASQPSFRSVAHDRLRPVVRQNDSISSGVSMSIT